MKWFAWLLRRAMLKATFYVSNLAGPPTRITFAGVEVTALYNFVNPSLAFVLSALSYAGDVTFAVAANSSVMPEPKLFLNDFLAEVAELEAAVGGKLKMN